MKVVINALSYKKNSSGIGVMIRSLCGTYTGVTRRKCQVIVPHDSPSFPAEGQSEIICAPWDYHQNLRRILFQAFTLGRQYCRNAVLLTSDSKCPFFLPKDCVLIPLVTDLAVYRMPKAYRVSRVLLWRLQYCYVRRRADHFLAISEFTKSEMVDLWKIPAEKIDVIPCACSETLHRIEAPKQLRAVKEKYGLPEQFVLFVGNSNPRKNLERLIRAFAAAKAEQGFPHRLVIVGELGWKFDRKKAVRGCGRPEDICFVGFVPDEDMAALYSAASLFVFPTLYEGFGIPILEAQSCGVPVLTSNCTSLPEVGGDGAYYVDPYSEKEIADGIGKLLAEPKLVEKLVQSGNANVKRFSWEASARKLDKIIEKEVEI